MSFTEPELMIIRTHRERKEQYIKALEAEVARLRDAYIIERKQVQQALEQQQMLLQDRHLENYALKEMFKARGITYDAELQNRKQQLMMSQSQNQTTNAGPMLQQHRNFSQLVQQPPSITFQPLTDPGFSNGGSSVMSGHSPNARQSHSPPAAQVLEYGQKPDKQIADMPGIFERDPQLGIDFILAYVSITISQTLLTWCSLEETCRDHGEYLVRRSMNSPNNAEQALFSGHALMASCPPPSHITSTPALSEGLQPTYPHQAPAVPMETLNTLLNLSQVIKSEGFFEGGQVTPIQALQSLRGHQGYRSLTRDDVIGMIDSIRNKVRCYGFGAVMEDFELRDALSSIFATKPEMYDHMHTDVTSQVEDMYS